MGHSGCIRPAMLARAVLLAAGLAAFAAPAALARGEHQARHLRQHDSNWSAPLKAVYTEDNLPSGNHILVFARAADGTIPNEPSETVSTGGVGLQSQPPFGFPMVDSQGALDITQDGRLLFAVNAGSNTISSFEVDSSGPRLVDQVNSGGTEPISLTHNGDLLYVVNEASGNISGFRFSGDGQLTPISHSTRSLATPGPGGVAAQIGFAPDGSSLTVTERCLQGCPLAPFGLIDTFRMHGDTPGPVQPHPADAPTPFGFAYRSSHNLIVTYAGYVATPSGTQPDPPDPTQFNGFISSDTLNWWGGLSPNGTIPSGGRATCWIVITGNGKYAFITNSLSDTVPDIGSGVGAISRVALSPSGQVSLLGLTNATPDSAGPAFPTDVALTPDSNYLYVAVPTLQYGLNTSHIDAYAVGSGGSLTHIDVTDDSLAGGISGIVAH